MSERVREAFEVLLERMEEPPAWEDLFTSEIDITLVSKEEKPAPMGGRGPLVAVAAAVLVTVVALVPLLTRPGGEAIVEDVISSTEGPAHFAVGFNGDGELCAQAGSASQSALVCGEDDLVAVAFHAYGNLAVAGFVPGSSAEVTVIYADGRRRSVDLVPIQGWDESAFGSILLVSDPATVEIEVTDGQGVVTHRRSVPVGSVADALGWETVAIPNRVDRPPFGAVWTGTELLLSGAAYTPDTGSWRELPGMSRLADTGVWTGSEAIFCCGTGSVAVRGLDTFHRTSTAPFRLDSPAKAVWTGEVMLVVSEGAGVASYDPESDRWELIAGHPVGNGTGTYFEVFWTGSELLVWGENEIGVALDPKTRNWRTLPEPPESFTHHDLAYTGSELVVWGESGSFSQSEPIEAIGAMLDLETDEWMELPKPLVDPTACECRLRGGQTTLWTGETLLISTSHLSSDAETNEPVLIAYHTDTNSWTHEGVSPLGWDDRFSRGGERAIMAGDRVVLISDRHLYISPPGWQPQGEPIPNDLLYAVGQR